MGLFDTIVIKPIKCPHCREIVVVSLQTKDGPCCMNLYKIGDRFPIADKSYLNNYLHKKIYPISVCGVCPKCEVFINGWGRVDVKTLLLKKVELSTYMRCIKPEIIIRKK